jgi:hypothetical protein
MSSINETYKQTKESIYAQQKQLLWIVPRLIQSDTCDLLQKIDPLIVCDKPNKKPPPNKILIDYFLKQAPENKLIRALYEAGQKSGLGETKDNFIEMIQAGIQHFEEQPTTIGNNNNTITTTFHDVSNQKDHQVSYEEFVQKVNSCKTMFKYSKALGIQNGRTMGQMELAIRVVDTAFINPELEQFKNVCKNGRVTSLWRGTEMDPVDALICRLDHFSTAHKSAKELEYSQAICNAGENKKNPIYNHLTLTDCPAGYIKGKDDECCQNIQNMLGSGEWDKMVASLAGDGSEKSKQVLQQQLTDLVTNAESVTSAGFQLNLVKKIKTNLRERMFYLFQNAVVESSQKENLTPCELEEKIRNGPSFYERATNKLKILTSKFKDNFGSFILWVYVNFVDTVSSSVIVTTLHTMVSRTVNFFLEHAAVFHILLGVLTKFKGAVCVTVGRFLVNQKQNQNPFQAVLKQMEYQETAKKKAPGEIRLRRKNANAEYQQAQNSYEMEKVEKNEKTWFSSWTPKNTTTPQPQQPEEEVRFQNRNDDDDETEEGSWSSLIEKIAEDPLEKINNFVSSYTTVLMFVYPPISIILKFMLDFIISEMISSIKDTLHMELLNVGMMQIMERLLELVDLEECVMLMPRQIREKYLPYVLYIKESLGMEMSTDHAMMMLGSDFNNNISLLIPEKVRYAYEHQEEDILKNTSENFRTSTFENVKVNEEVVKNFYHWTQARHKAFFKALSEANKRHPGNEKNITKEMFNVIKKQSDDFQKIFAQFNKKMS